MYIIKFATKKKLLHRYETFDLKYSKIINF